MTDCAECFYELEDDADECPSCGAPVHDAPGVDMNEFDWVDF